MIHGLQPTLAEGGKIKIGGLGETRKSKGGGEYRLPRKDDHFTITSTTRDDNGDLAVDTPLMESLLSQHADSDLKLRSIPIVLHSDDIEDVFPTAYVLYSGKKMLCRGDGQTAMGRKLGQDGVPFGEASTRPCPCKHLNSGNRKLNCKPHGTLHCSILSEGQSVAGSVHKWRTTSIISIKRMVGSLLQIQSTCGTLRGLPLWLKLVPITVSPDGVGSSTVYCCHIELRASDLQSVQQQALKTAQMRSALGNENGAAYRALIQQPGWAGESDDEQRDVAAEFHPRDLDDDAVGLDGLRQTMAENGDDEPPLEAPLARQQDQPSPEDQEANEKAAPLNVAWLQGNTSGDAQENPHPASDPLHHAWTMGAQSKKLDGPTCLGRASRAIDAGRKAGGR